ncbi:long-chain fatty acid--CoA ligase [Psychrosphaera sp.]|nr:long-chain fatty acid--CoA ligase [Psychrosphaera sp.]
MLAGAMMNADLTINSIMSYAKKVYGNVEIVSVTHDHERFRYTYKDAFKRVDKLANALSKLGLQRSDRVATIAWNDHRHFELYYAISCSGFVCHTINPRLYSEQLEYILHHAADKVIFVDKTLLPALEAVKDSLPELKATVVLCEEQDLPESDLNLIAYETLIADEPDSFEYPELDEQAASSLCYTSGTTGNPKGVLYSHRSTVLHSFSISMPNSMSIGNNEVIMPIVPMFHVNAWGLPYACPMSGAKLVFPGNKMADGETLTNLINTEKVTMSAGVPTVWLALLNYLKQSNETIESVKRFIVGGAACPLGLMKGFAEYGVEMQHAWGMTELSPLGTINVMKPELLKLDEQQLDQIRVKQGLPVYGVEMKIVDDEDNELPWDGEASGNLKVKGAWVCSSYFNQTESDAHDRDGWFSTGDVVTFDEHSYMMVTDRSKDVIKSGGEWISSIELENIASDHPDIMEAAVIGIPDPKWTERPAVFAIKMENAEITEQQLIDSFEGKTAKWCIPEQVTFVEELPHTATGKLDKKQLRKLYL